MTTSPGSVIQLSGFPVGYFVVKNAASGRVFDVLVDEVKDGTPVIVYDDKEKTLVESFRNPENNNQVFFIDCSGALCSRSSGHPLDVEGEEVVLRHRRPISFPFPNKHAHPLPRFIYSEETGEISIKFMHDPSYPSPDEPRSSDWEQKTYLLTTRVNKMKVGGESPSKRKSLLGKLFKSVAPGRKSGSHHAHSTQRVPDESSATGAAEEDVEANPEQEIWVDVPGAYNFDIRVVAVNTATKAADDMKLDEETRLMRQWLIHPLKD